MNELNQWTVLDLYSVDNRPNSKIKAFKMAIRRSPPPLFHKGNTTFHDFPPSLLKLTNYGQQQHINFNNVPFFQIRGAKHSKAKKPLQSP